MNYIIKAYEPNNPKNFFTFSTLEEYYKKIGQVLEYFGYVPHYEYAIMIPENQKRIIF